MRLADRPQFARKLLAVWRLQHLAAGDDMHVVVWPGEWPDSQPREVKGVPVDESDKIGGPGSVMVMGRARGSWRCVYQLAFPQHSLFSAQELAIICGYFDVPDDGAPMKVWMHPDPVSGAVPMWEVARRA